MPDTPRATGAVPRAADAAAPPAEHTIGALRRELAATLAAAGVPLAREEARDMIAALLDVPRFWPTANAGEPAAPELAASAARAVARRVAGAPFAYAVRRSAFRHLSLDVDERVLIPRQETELLPEIVLDLTGGGAGVAVDVGTGSGAIALSLATEGAFTRVIATDISLDALAVARGNAAHLRDALRAPVELRHGSGLAPVRGERVRVVVSNPPYITFGEMGELPPSVRDWEPTVALCCGGDGLDVTAALVRDAAAILEPDGVLALEVDARRAGLVAECVASDGRYREIAVRLDLTGRERFVVARRAGNPARRF